MRRLGWGVLMFLLVGSAGCGGCSSTERNTTPKDRPRNTTPKKTEATNKDKIVGTWEMTKGTGDTPPGAILEFAKDGKVKMSAKVEGKQLNMEGTYEVDGDKLTITRKDPAGKERKETETITKLTDEELITKDAKDKTTEFKKK